LQSFISFISFVLERLIRINNLTSILLDVLLLFVFFLLFIVVTIAALNSFDNLYFILFFKIIDVFEELLIAKSSQIILNTFSLFAKDIKASRSSISCSNNINCATNC